MVPFWNYWREGIREWAPQMEASMVQGRLKNLSLVAVALGFSALANAATPKVEAVPGEFLVKVKNAKAFRTNALSAFGAENFRTVSQKQNIYLVKRNMLERADFAMEN